ncbi:MAG: ABC transporter ATP-binding protein [Nitrospirae bacterium GWC2_56_14]|nr:MAG: ABC transporter ATP-binding protein [Nitrospirae bacterium GWC2_56_14]
MKLDVSHLTKTYDKKTILNDCSYVFDKTGTYVLMGPNGCGKSTFLRICAMLERQDSGDIAYFDNSTVLANDITLKRRLTLVLPRTGVFNTTVFKNVAYGLKIRGLHHTVIERKVNAALDFVGLGPKTGQHARTLSSGETQRLGIARALVLEPEVLFLDEPTASIDEENTQIIESIIGAMKKEGRSTIIMTTHDREQATRVGDFQLVMRNGRIET